MSTICTEENVHPPKTQFPHAKSTPSTALHTAQPVPQIISKILHGIRCPLLHCRNKILAAPILESHPRSELSNTKVHVSAGAGQHSKLSLVSLDKH
eukprot:1137197-Pelagomonas_calceolata.AAC.4